MEIDGVGSRPPDGNSRHSAQKLLSAVANATFHRHFQKMNPIRLAIFHAEALLLYPLPALIDSEKPLP